MVKFRNMMDIVTDGQDSIICVIKEATAERAACIKEMLLDGKYWIRSKETGEISPAIPEELMEAESAMSLDTAADYIIFSSDFNSAAYWNTVNTNAPIVK